MKVLSLLLALFTSTLTATDPLSTPAVYTNSDKKMLPYRIYKPKNLKENIKIPLILFLHGAGERGNDNAKQLVHGFNDLVKYSEANNQPCFIIAPQCPANMQWVNVKWSDPSHSLPKEPSEPLKLALELLEQQIKELAVDQNRIYITGISMGGFGTWDAISRKPNLFAAALPICGGADIKMAEKLTHLPIWTIHGEADKSIPVARSREMVEALKKAGGHPIYTEHPKMGHNVWSISYADKKILDWLFSQKNSAK